MLGAGPAGLGAALSLGRDAVVLERAADPGGLCRTVEIDGAVFDIGGHSFHTPHARVRELVFDALPMYEQKREARCWYADQLIEYPFQAHFDQLDDPDVVEACARGLAMAHGVNGARQFDDYLRNRFGEGLARHFLLPYNRKLWGTDLARLSADWAGERIASPTGADAAVPDPERRRPLRDDTVVAYPATGGFDGIFRALARRVPGIVFDRTVESIDPQRCIVTTTQGGQYAYDSLISTLPLPDLIARLTTPPRWAGQELARLEAIGLALVFVVVRHPVDTPVQRIYCGDPACPVHKFVLNHNSSGSLRALPHHGILAEISLAHARDRHDLAGCVVRALLKLGLLRSTRDVVATRVWRIERAYPVPTRDRGAIVGRMTSWLAERRIHTIGRFGEWAYINSDEALYRGLVTGQRLKAS